MDTLGYVRVSDERKQDPASQIALMLTMGIVKENIFTDLGSGTTEPMKRSSYAMMFARIASGGIDALVISEFSRIGRTVDESLSAILDIRKKGVRIVSLSESEKFLNDIPYDLQPMVLSGMMYAASQERKHISERTRWGLENARKQGKKFGRPKVDVDFAKVKELMDKFHLREAQAVRVAGYSMRNFYTKKKALQNLQPK